MTTLLDALEHFARQVPGLLNTSIVHTDEGTSIGAVAHDDDLDGAAADAWFAEMLVKNQQALDAAGFDDVTEDIVTTSASSFALTRPLAGTDYFWTAITTRSGNPGLTRALMRKFEAQIIESLP